jgi:hypothetical protein
MMIRVLLVLALSITGCQAERPHIVRGTGFLGVIFPRNVEAPPFPKSDGYWTPSESDVFAAEEGLKAFLKQSNNDRVPEIVARLDTYKRQYFGIILGGQKQIAIRFLCEGSSIPLNWTKEVDVINDGGSCFFNVRFTTKTKSFSDLQINGMA